MFKTHKLRKIMHPIIKKSFGGLSAEYYFRHLFFAFFLCAPLAIFLLLAKHNANSTIPIEISILSLVNTFLYPYARYVYEAIYNFILGENIFLLPIIISIPFKLIMMLACWSFSILIAPLGLIYLYFYHSKSSS